MPPLPRDDERVRDLSSSGLLLLLGASPEVQHLVEEALHKGALGCTLVALPSLDSAFDTLDDLARRASSPDGEDSPDVVLLISQGMAERGWEVVAVALRRSAPSAALIAMPEGAESSWLDRESGAELYHDVIAQDDRSPALLARILRCGFVVARAARRLSRLAMRDPLTDVLNRRGLERVLLRESSDAERGSGALTALLVDCDNFKRVNDLFGLSVGDDVLRMVAEVLTRSVRARDTVARVGGDEFLVLLPNTRVQSAVEVADRIRREIRKTLLLPDGDALTVSIGVRRIDGRTSLRDVVEATQDGLSQSKRDGKDQVRVVDPIRGDSATVSPPPERAVFLPSGEVTKRLARSLETGLPLLAQIEPIAEAALGLSPSPVQIATLRASHPDIDRLWIHCALSAMTEPIPSFIRIYPRTLASHTPESLLLALPQGAAPSLWVLSIDDQALSGDPSLLASRLNPLRDRGQTLAIEAADLGRSFLEAIILIRPEYVLLDASLVRGVGGSRILPAELSRVARVCESLSITVIAGEVASEADRRALLQIGIRAGIPAADFPVDRWTDLAHGR